MSVPDDVSPIAESRELVRASGLPESATILMGSDHPLADREPPGEDARDVRSGRLNSEVGIVPRRYLAIPGRVGERAPSDGDEARAIGGQDSEDWSRMSYDLNFWKQQPGSILDPQGVYERLSEGERVEGLEELPINRIMARIAETFTEGWERLDPENWESSQGSFQVSTTPQSLRVDCYGLTGEVMNLFIEIGQEFGCPLYDPQTGVRFEDLPCP
jgi:hypothetical protein